MTLLHVPYIRYREFTYTEPFSFSHAFYHIMVPAILVAGFMIVLLAIGQWLGTILKRQTEPYMKFIYQLYPWKCTNQTPSIVEQTEEQAKRTARELSVFYNVLVVVRYPDDRGILCMAEQGELTELDTLKTLEFI